MTDQYNDKGEVEVVSFHRMLQRWIREARWFAGVDFIPGVIKGNAYGEAKDAIKNGGTPKDARRAVIRCIYAYSIGSNYRVERQKRNWWMVKPSSELEGRDAGFVD